MKRFVLIISLSLLMLGYFLQVNAQSATESFAIVLNAEGEWGGC